jgi:hypothetical protein
MPFRHDAGVFRPNGVSRRNFDGLKTPNPSSFAHRVCLGKKVVGKNPNGVSAKCAIPLRRKRPGVARRLPSTSPQCATGCLSSGGGTAGAGEPRAARGLSQCDLHPLGVARLTLQKKRIIHYLVPGQLKPCPVPRPLACSCVVQAPGRTLPLRMTDITHHDSPL